MDAAYQASYYLCALAIFLLFSFFFIEPRWNTTKILIQTKTYRVRHRDIAMCLTSIPFMYLLIGFLLQSPELLRHSVSYNIFFLRTQDNVNGAHYFDYLMIPIMYFIALFLFDFDGFYSALTAGFLAFVHESIWFVFYYLTYGQYFNSNEAIWDFSFIIFISTVAFIYVKKYPSRIKTKVFGLGVACYVLFLELWYSQGFKVTVINNTSIGNVKNFLSTVWYWDKSTNEFEVFSWIIIFCVFLLNLFYVRNREKIREKNLYLV